MLELKVRKIGNSLGVVLPKEAVSRLHADEGDRLFLIEGPNGVYQLTPYDPAFEKEKVALIGSLRQQRRDELFRSFMQEARKRVTVQRNVEAFKRAMPS